MFRKILVPLDGSALAEEALARAVAIARASHARIELVLVQQPSGLSSPESEINAWRGHDRYLESLVRELASGGGLQVSECVPKGDPAEAICERARAVGADLIVMTSHGRTGVSRAWLGSVADEVMRRSRVPVLMLKPAEGESHANAPSAFRRILVPLDGSDVAAGVLVAATNLARCAAGRMLLLRIVPPIPLVSVDPMPTFVYGATLPDDEATKGLVALAREELAGVQRALAAGGIRDVECHVIAEPNVAQAILEFSAAQHIDAIAMSTRGRGASRLIIGSVADKVLRGSPVPVLLERPVPVSAEPALIDADSVEEQLPAMAGVCGQG